MINKIWTILNRGEILASPYSRKLTPYLYREDWPNQRALDILVPFSVPVLEQHFRIEQLIQGALKSSVAGKVEELDPLNTYQKAEITYPEAGFADDSIYEAYYPSDVGDGESFSIACVLDPGIGIFTADGEEQTFTVTADLTSGLDLPNGKQVRFRGPFIGADSFTIAYTPYLKVPWQEILEQLSNITITWPDNNLRLVWLNDYFWLNRASAVVLAVAQGEES
jgi:hypothetical protein